MLANQQSDKDKDIAVIGNATSSLERDLLNAIKLHTPDHSAIRQMMESMAAMYENQTRVIYSSLPACNSDT